MMGKDKREDEERGKRTEEGGRERWKGEKGEPQKVGVGQNQFGEGTTQPEKAWFNKGKKGKKKKERKEKERKKEKKPSVALSKKEKSFRFFLLEDDCKNRSHSPQKIFFPFLLFQTTK